MPRFERQGYVMMHPEAAVRGQDVMAVVHTLAERASHLARLPAIMDPTSLSTLVTAMKGSDPLSRVRELDKAAFGWAHEVCSSFSVSVKVSGRKRRADAPLWGRRWASSRAWWTTPSRS
jgi:hypothetical protein